MVFLLLSFIVINSLVATRTPVVFGDEPQLVDPAASLYFGAGFTSTIWGQDHTAFWSGYAPLYPGILALVFKLAGFGFFQARVVNTLLAAAGAWLVWLGLRRSGLVRELVNRLLCITLVLSGSASTLTFRTIRPDTTMFAVCALVFFACCLPPPSRVRYVLAFLAAALLPMSGISVAVYAGIMMFLNLAIFGFANIRLLVAIGLGMLAGVGALALFYAHFSSVQVFVQMMLPMTGFNPKLGTGVSFVHLKIFGESWGGPNLFTCFFGNPFEIKSRTSMLDYSAVMLFAAAVYLLFLLRRAFPLPSHKFIIYVIAATLVVPPLMHLAGHYPAYYRWMTYFPLALLLPRLLEIQRDAGGGAFPRRAVLAVIAMSLCLGIPLRTVAVIPTWTRRSQAPLEQVTAQIVRPSDVVIADFKTYFVMRPRCRLFYGFGMPAAGDFTNITDLPTNDISLLCLSPEDLTQVTNRIGGNWKMLPLDAIPAAPALAQSRYAVEYYRRATSP